MEDSIISNVPEEALARARFCLARLYSEQSLHPEEAEVLRKDAMDVLGKYRSVVAEDDLDAIMDMFDDLQPVSGRRFTGLTWLQSRQSSM